MEQPIRTEIRQSRARIHSSNDRPGRVTTMSTAEVVAAGVLIGSAPRAGHGLDRLEPGAASAVPLPQRLQQGDFMIRTTMAFAGALCIAWAGTAVAQVVTGGAGNTGVAPPARVGGVAPGARDLGPSPITRGNEANPSNTPVPGTTPGVNIGGTPTSGPPGTGGTSGGPSLDGR